MAQLSQTYANMVLNALLNGGTFTPPTHPIYFGLATSSTGLRTSSFANEISTVGTGYARVVCGVAQPISWTVATAGLSSNDATLTMPTASGDWGVCTHGFLATDLTAGTCLLYGELSPNRDVISADILRFLIGEMDISL